MAGADLDPHGWLLPRAAGKQAIEQNMCGPCHSRREAIGPDTTLPGEVFGDHYKLSYLTDGGYFADGQQDGESYVFGSFSNR
ncbi:hypothetical protein A4U53_039790 (plasmid) [Rhizobium ruizarguesonis]|uniref:Cytochrome c domain-containing protein n=2 Tax=Rhizobium TaxID=379 RepID=A0A179BPP4_RHILE|nr:hypothetical protein [Rhizobium leguminosarum]OAP93747.1 hypothetical protein A4U53_23565 [Rhizobium leguminosarum]